METLVQVLGWQLPGLVVVAGQREGFTPMQPLVLWKDLALSWLLWKGALTNFNTLLVFLFISYHPHYCQLPACLFCVSLAMYHLPVCRPHIIIIIANIYDCPVGAL